MNGHVEADSKQKAQPSDAENKDSHAAPENSNGQQTDAASGDKSSSSRKPLTIDPHHGSDTTYKKIFIGGLAWQTTTERLREHFSVYGQLVEAVVIADRLTGRSKGYGFVTFVRDEDAGKALKNPSPTIDGRKTNCNLAAFGTVRPPRERTNMHTSGPYHPRADGSHASHPHQPNNGYDAAHYGGRHAGSPYYYDQHGMVMYAPPAAMESQHTRAGYAPMAYPVMSSPSMAPYNPYMGFNMMMQARPAAAGMMMPPQPYMMPPNYEPMMYGMRGMSHDMDLHHSMSELSLNQ